MFNNDDESFNSINVSGRIVGYINGIEKNEQTGDIYDINENNNSNQENKGEIINLNGIVIPMVYIQI